MSGRPFRDHNITGGSHHSHPVGVEELPVPLTDLPELKLKVPLLVEDLDPVVVGVSHDDLVILGDSYTAWLSELSLQDAELPELAMVDHLLTPDLRLRWVDDGGGRHWGGKGGGGAHGEGHRVGDGGQHV